MDEFVPRTLSEHVFAVFAYLIAFWFGAALISTLTSLMTQFFIDGSKESVQFSLLRKYLERNQISKNLATRMMRNAKHVLKQRESLIHEEFVEVIQLVTEPLKIELHFEIYGPSLSAHPFFEMYSLACRNVVKRICHSAMSMMLAAIGDVIFDLGEIPTSPRMYIVKDCVLDYRLHRGEHWELDEGSWVAEAVLWVAWTHQGTLTACQDCCLYTLDANEFQTIASHFEYSADFDPRVYAKLMVSHLNSRDPGEVSDVVSVPSLEGVFAPRRAAPGQKVLGQKSMTIGISMPRSKTTGAGSHRFNPFNK